VDTLSYINKRGYCHRDIKLENLMVNQEFKLKVIDFGFVGQANQDLTIPIGTPYYLAPEIMRAQKYRGELVDVYAAGVTLFALTQGQFPFKGQERIGKEGGVQAFFEDSMNKLFFDKQFEEYW